MKEIFLHKDNVKNPYCGHAEFISASSNQSYIKIPKQVRNDSLSVFIDVNKIKYVIILILLIPHFAISANPDTTIRKWSVGVSGSFDYTDNYIFTKSNLKDDINFVKYSNTSNKSSTGYSCGLNIFYNYNNNLSIGIGLQYQIVGYQHYQYFYYSDIKNNSTAAYTYTDTIYVRILDKNDPVLQNNGSMLNKINYKNYYAFINLPITIKYKFLKNNFRPFISGGLISSLLLYRKIVQIKNFMNGDTIVSNRIYIGNDNNGIRKINLTFMLSTGFDLKISNKLSITIEPTVRCNMFPIINSYDIRNYLYFIGLNAGLYYNF